MKRLRVRWVRSGIGQRETHRLTVRALGLHRLGQIVEHNDTPAIRGMVTKVRHLVEVEEIEEQAQ